MTPLRRRMIEDMSLRGLPEATQRAYVNAVRNLAGHFKRSPDQLTDAELRRFFISLKRRRAKSTVRMHLFAHDLRVMSPTNVGSMSARFAKVARCRRYP